MLGNYVGTKKEGLFQYPSLVNKVSLGPAAGAHVMAFKPSSEIMNNIHAVFPDIYEKEVKGKALGLLFIVGMKCCWKTF